MQYFTSPGDTEELTPEEERKHAEIKARDRAISHILRVAYVVPSISCLSIIVGIVIISKAKNGTWLITTGGPIWSGAFMLLQVVITVPLQFTNSSWSSDSVSTPTGDRCKQRYLMSFIFWLSMTTSAFPTLISAMVSIFIVNDCKRVCGTNFEVELIMNIIGAILGIILFILSVLTCVLCCYHRKAFHLDSLDDRLKHYQRTGEIFTEE